MLEKIKNRIIAKRFDREIKKELEEIEKLGAGQQDPYVYKGTNVLKNKLGIKDGSILEQAETELTVHNLLNVDEKIRCEKGKFDFEHLKKIHKHIFGDLYKWAGKPRTIDIYKSEVVLNDLSVEYSNHEMIEKDMKAAIDNLNSVKWDKLNNEEIVKEFAHRIAEVWKVHAFREGNTRTTMTFACQYAEAHGFKLDKTVFRENSGYVRNSLVMASIGEYAEPKYLEGKIREAIGRGQAEQIKDRCMMQLLDREKEVLGFIKYKIQEVPTVENVEKLIGYAQSKVQEFNGANAQKYEKDLKLFEKGKEILEGVDRRVIKEVFVKETGVNLDHSTTEKIRRLNQKDSMFHTYSSLKNYPFGRNERAQEIVKEISKGKGLIR